MKKLTQADIAAMSVDTKLELVEAIWDSIAASQDEVPVPQWHTEIIEKRLADRHIESDSWENVKKRLEQ